MKIKQHSTENILQSDFSYIQQKKTNNRKLTYIRDISNQLKHN